MPRRNEDDDIYEPSRPPATDARTREMELINLAYDLAEKQLREGTASSPVINSFLKAGSSREVLEQEKIRYENELTRVKKASMEAAERREALFQEVIVAMGIYSGQQPATEVDDAPEELY